jgi:SAM-dependent methyltransferase
MFASRPEAVAAELARVVRPGGRLVLTTWRPDSTIFEMFKTMKPYMPPPPSPPPPSPFEWGREDRVGALLGTHFDLTFEPGTTVLRMPSGDEVWSTFFEGYGPTRVLANSLDPQRREALRRDFVALHERHRGSCGIAMPRDYLVTLGVRK